MGVASRRKRKHKADKCFIGVFTETTIHAQESDPASLQKF